tara:strand:+ start:166 stop:810 length:645 start_codon:yes stop_codon:yes gene_type:complete
MNDFKLNYKIKIIDNFLDKSDFEELNNLKLKKDFNGDFQVYHNKINDEQIIEATIEEKLLKKIHKNYFLKTFKILEELNPQKSKLYDYSDFTIIITKKNSKFPIHDDTPDKLLSGVVYLQPKENSGTIFYNDKEGSNKTEIEWKPNRAVFFSRIERQTWHSYEGDGKNDRIALVYNLKTNKIRDVYKAEGKSFFLGNLRYKINPYLFQYFKKTI